MVVAREDELGRLAVVFNDMAARIAAREQTLSEQDWMNTSLARLSRLLEGARDPARLGAKLLPELAVLSTAAHGRSEEALQIGTEMGSETAAQMFGVTMFVNARARGGLEPLLPMFVDMVAERNAAQSLRATQSATAARLAALVCEVLPSAWLQRRAVCITIPRWPSSIALFVWWIRPTLWP